MIDHDWVTEGIEYPICAQSIDHLVYVAERQSPASSSNDAKRAN